jgi:hypothetical protein
MLNKLFLFILLISTSFTYAQKLDAVRIEVPSDINIEQFHVEPIGESGLLIFYESAEVNKDKKRKWYFGLFNTQLKQQWLKFVPLFDKMEFVSLKNTNGKVYFLFKNINSERFEYGYYEIVIYNIKRQSFSQVSGSIPLKAVVVGFEVIDNTACIALNIKKNVTDVVFVNLVNGDVKPVHINEGVQGYIETMYADMAHSVFYVVVKQNKDRRYITDHLISYSVSGSMLAEIDIEVNETIKYFRDYVFVPRNGNELLIFGTYDILTGRTLSFKDVEEEKEAKNAGIFFMKIKDGKQESLYFYDFMGFKNIKGAIRLKDISTLKLPNDTTSVVSGNQLISTSFSLSEPTVFKADNGNYIFSAEAYRPYYRTETRMDYDFYGRPYPYTYNVFSGYEFYDVIVAGLSSDGNLLWNNDFVIEDILTYSTKRNSAIFEDDNFVTIAYVNNGAVISQTIEGPVDIDRSKMKIGTNFPQDRVSQDENNHIVSWYDNYFLIYGYQKLKNRTMGDQSTRMVFYANKLTYR